MVTLTTPQVRANTIRSVQREVKIIIFHRIMTLKDQTGPGTDAQVKGF